MSVEGTLEGKELSEAVLKEHPAISGNLGRWFLEEPLYDAERTWVVSKMWGLNTPDTLEALAALAPIDGFGFEPVGS
jgi:hypothetical protein